MRNGGYPIQITVSQLYNTCPSYPRHPLPPSLLPLLSPCLPTQRLPGTSPPLLPGPAHITLGVCVWFPGAQVTVLCGRDEGWNNREGRKEGKEVLICIFHKRHAIKKGMDWEWYFFQRERKWKLVLFNLVIRSHPLCSGCFFSSPCFIIVLLRWRSETKTRIVILDCFIYSCHSVIQFIRSYFMYFLFFFVRKEKRKSSVI